MILKKLKPLNLLLFFFLTILYFEILFRFFTIGTITFSNLLIITSFSLALATICYLLSALARNKAAYIMSIVLVVLMTLFFISQLLYYKFFSMFYTIYSLTNANEAFSFWREVVVEITNNLLPFILFWLPLIVLILSRKFLFPINLPSFKYNFALVVLVVIFHFMGIGLINAGDKGHNTAYDLYYQTDIPMLAMQKFGLATTMRLDIQRSLTGWIPQVNAGELPSENENEQVGNREETTTEYNVMEIDFDQFIAEEENEQIKAMHKYFKNAPATAKNDFTGIYEGYNLIFITAEAFSPFAIHEEATPTLYKMLHEGYNFTNFYTPLWGVSTSDGEYVATTGILPKNGMWSFSASSNNYLPFAMGNQLRELNYKTMAYHNHTYTYYDRHKSHPNMGYEYKGLGNGLNVTEVWPASDLEMMELSIPEFINDQPFHAYYMTVSGHTRYNFGGNNMAIKNRNVVKDLPLSTGAQAYIATQVELDRAMEYLLNSLEEAGVADTTLIAMSADHYPYGLSTAEIDELAGHKVENNFELYKNHFILYTPNMEPTTIDKPASSLDILPTISNLLGLEFDSRLLMGKDIFSDSDPLVIFFNRSFITDKGKYNGVNYQFTSFSDINYTQKEIEQMVEAINAKFYYSARILETDYYNIIFNN